MHRIERYPDWKEKNKRFTYVLIVDVKLYKILEQNYLPLGKCYLYAIILIIHFEWDFIYFIKIFFIFVFIILILVLFCDFIILLILYLSFISLVILSRFSFLLKFFLNYSFFLFF